VPDGKITGVGVYLVEHPAMNNNTDGNR
jgi:hypothetical protein